MLDLLRPCCLAAVLLLSAHARAEEAVCPPPAAAEGARPRLGYDTFRLGVELAFYRAREGRARAEQSSATAASASMLALFDGPFGIDAGLRAAFGSGRDVAYDVYLGGVVGHRFERFVPMFVAGGGSDSTNLDAIGRAFYGYLGGELHFLLARELRLEASFRQLFKTDYGNERRFRAGLAFACFGGERGCLQLGAYGFFTQYAAPDAATSYGGMIGATVYDAL